MKTTTLIIILGTAVFAPVQAGTIGVDPTNGGTALVSGFGGLTLGFEFQVSATDGIVVDGLGFWDHQSEGFLFGQTFHVGLWDAATGALLRNSVITSASRSKPSLHPDGDWRVNSVSPVFLAPGLYRMGALMPEAGGNPIVDDFGVGIQSEPGIAVVRFLRQVGSPTLAMPNIPPPTPGLAYFGPTFTFTPGPLVVVPAAVAPSDYASTNGNTGLNTLLRGAGGPRTYQMQFSPTALVGLPIGARITELRFRLSTNAASAFPASVATWAGYEVTLAQAANSISGMSADFASNMLSPVLVKNGPLSIGTDSFAAGAIPNAFGSLVVFDRPYVYQGGGLVMIFRHTGSDSGSTAFFDAANSSSPAYGTAFRAISANSFSASSGVSASVTIVQMVFTPPIIQTISLDGADVVIGGSGGSTGVTYHILTSTNLALPLGLWTPVITNRFDGSGGLRYTNAITPDSPAKFFRIALP